MITIFKNKFSAKTTLSIILVLFIISGIVSIPTKSADAQVAGSIACNSGALFSAVSGAAGSGTEVPVGDAQTRGNTDASKNVSCTWNGIAWQLAHIVLHQLTGNVVNWINSGFQGSPAFLTNPTGFFTNVGDQLTGYFIGGSGVLSSLCSPFNTDVRLAIALGQSSTYKNEYTCTLSTIINSVSNSTINGQSIQGFMNGDFSQGGWQGFIAVGNPGNNPGRVYLQAQSDLSQRIGQKQSQYDKQLLQGGGFLTYHDCKDISADQVQAAAAAQGVDPLGLELGAYNGNTGINAGDNPTWYSQDGGNINAVTNKDGSISYQSCQDLTPGSVISSALNKELGAPTDELNMTHDINEIVSALFSQLLTKTLSGGLLSSSQPSYSNGNQSIINQLVNNDRQTQSNATYLQSQVSGQLLAGASGVQQATLYRTQIIANLTTELGRYQTTMSCIANKLAAASSSRSNNTYSTNNSQNNTPQLSFDYIQNEYNLINGAIASIYQMISTAQTTLQSASSTLAMYQDAANQIQATSTLEAANNLSNQLSIQLSSMPYNSASDPTVAQSDLKTTNSNIASLENSLKQYQMVCNGQQAN